MSAIASVPAAPASYQPGTEARTEESMEGASELAGGGMAPPVEGESNGGHHAPSPLRESSGIPIPKEKEAKEKVKEKEKDKVCSLPREYPKIFINNSCKQLPKKKAIL